MDDSIHRYPGKRYSAVKNAVVNVTTDTTTQVVAAVTGAKIVVLGGMLTFSAGAGTHTWKSAATALSGAMGMGEQKFGGVWPMHEAGYLETAAAEALNLTTAGGATVKGFLRYVEET